MKSSTQLKNDILNLLYRTQYVWYRSYIDNQYTTKDFINYFYNDEHKQYITPLLKCIHGNYNIVEWCEILRLLINQHERYAIRTTEFIISYKKNFFYF